MDIAILCAVALVATVLAWLYLSNRKPKQEKEECVDVVLSNPAEVLPEDAHLLKKPTGKQKVFLGLMLIALCAMSVALELIYDKNTLLDNLKLITLLALLFTAAYVDAREKIIPNMVVLAGLVLRVAFWVAELFVIPDKFLSVVKDNLLACLLVVIFFVIGVLVIKGGLGMGDIKLMLVMCLFQGFYGVVSALFCALFAAFVYAIVVLIMKKKSRNDSVAFAPAILLGTLLSVFLTGM